MRNKLKVTAHVECETCMCSMKRVKTIYVSAETKEEAREEADIQIKEWRKSLEGKNCRICDSIIKSGN